MQTTNRRLVLFFILLLALVAGAIPVTTIGESAGQVWQVGAKRWSVAEENHFAQWVEASINEDFFIRHNIAIDCADVPYAVRWIYARIAHLPAAVTTEDGLLFGNWSTAFSYLPTAKEWYRDRRFRQSLLHILELTSTKTLPQDTYPIRISAGSLTAGAIFLHDGHAGIIGRIVTDGSTYSPVQTWEATLPRKITQLRQRNYFGTDIEHEQGTGLLRFRWPQFNSGRWLYFAVEQEPFFSLEQYSSDFCKIGESFDDAIARRIDPKPRSPAKRVHLIIDSIYRYLLDRVKLVQTGFAYCRKNGCPEGSSSWEIYSTPSRDEKIGLEIYYLKKLIVDNGLDAKTLEREMAQRTIPITMERTITLLDVIHDSAWLSHDPNDSIEARWGVTKCEMILKEIRNALVDLDFAEQRYRSTDPAYADRLREKTMYKIERLHDEEQRSSCFDLPPGRSKNLSRQPPLPISAP
ncbi:hypothetical protein [Desulfopila aestuarii]|uniref:Uncharacterized protein n=1 Tax=Desulfopila aestuarii DSM 18488 TaxID=1121416 RepID=A0A1M7XXP8_9BACT|nr:hypothetical protein [Desulfopila aestuarii]SHO43602.1 hypothetical protein SAMN02745220_00437 [Desulfopila aestuarii DSM 18488]